MNQTYYTIRTTKGDKLYGCFYMMYDVFRKANPETEIVQRLLGDRGWEGRENGNLLLNGHWFLRWY